MYFEWLILQLYQCPKIHFHWFFLVIILGFNNSTTSRFPNLMRPFQIQSFFLILWPIHPTEIGPLFYYFWQILEYYRYILVYFLKWFFLVCQGCYFYFLYALRSPNRRSTLSALRSTLTYGCRPGATWGRLAYAAPTGELGTSHIRGEGSKLGRDVVGESASNSDWTIGTSSVLANCHNRDKD